MSARPLDRAAVGLGAASVSGLVFLILKGDTWGFVRVSAVAAIVLLVFGGLAIAGGRAGRPQWVLIAGAAHLIAALLQLGLLGRSADFIGGDGSTFSFLLGLGVGLTLVARAQLSATAARISDNAHR